MYFLIWFNVSIGCYFIVFYIYIFTFFTYYFTFFAFIFFYIGYFHIYIFLYFHIIIIVCDKCFDKQETKLIASVS